MRTEITNSKAIRELAGNPLLLTMMAILNRSQELPRDRATLYEKASGLLLHQWDVEAKVLEDAEFKKFPVVIDLKDKQAMLRQIAYQMQGKEKGLAGNLIDETQLEDILTNYLKTIKEVPQARDIARLTIKQLRIRNFILCYLGANSYAFVHRTFLEYFCAWEFLWQCSGTLKGAATQTKRFRCTSRGCKPLYLTRICYRRGRLRLRETRSGGWGDRVVGGCDRYQSLYL